MEVTIRIDGNKKYEYAKQHLTLIDDVIYVVEDNTNRLSLHLLNDGYIAYTYTKYSNNVSELLKLIHQNYHDIVIAIKIIQKEPNKIIEDIANIQGLTISNW